MKLLTQKETNVIFLKHSKESDGLQYMDCIDFNNAVNHILHNETLVKMLLKRVKKIKNKS